jgi:hypothetical protein
VSQQKTIDEMAKEVTHEWHKLSWVTRFHQNGEPPSFEQLAKAGILAGLQMAAEVCEVAAVKEANKADAADRRNHEDQVLKHESRQEVLVKARDAILALKGGE